MTVPLGRAAFVLALVGVVLGGSTKDRVDLLPVTAVLRRHHDYGFCESNSVPAKRRAELRVPPVASSIIRVVMTSLGAK